MFQNEMSTLCIHHKMIELESAVIQEEVWSLLFCHTVSTVWLYSSWFSHLLHALAMTPLYVHPPGSLSVCVGVWRCTDLQLCS